MEETVDALQKALQMSLGPKGFVLLLNINWKNAAVFPLQNIKGLRFLSLNASHFNPLKKECGLLPGDLDLCAFQY